MVSATPVGVPTDGMTTYALEASDLAHAAGSLDDAAASIASADGDEAYDAVRLGMPGSTTAEIMPDVASAMTTAVSELRTDLERFAENLSRTADDGVAIDEAAGGIFNLSAYILTGE